MILIIILLPHHRSIRVFGSIFLPSTPPATTLAYPPSYIRSERFLTVIKRINSINGHRKGRSSYNTKKNISRQRPHNPVQAMMTIKSEKYCIIPTLLVLTVLVDSCWLRRLHCPNKGIFTYLLRKALLLLLPLPDLHFLS